MTKHTVTRLPQNNIVYTRKVTENELVRCKFCHQEELVTLSHLHDGEWVCPECWDERLKNTE